MSGGHLIYEKVNSNLYHLESCIRGNITRKLPSGEPAADAWLRLTGDLDKDRVDQATGKNYLGLLNAPAAKKNHHAELGGLVMHYLEMWEIFKDIRGNILPRTDDSDSLYQRGEEHYVTNERVLEGILLHDLSKAYFTFVLDKEGKFDYGDHPSGTVMGGMLKNDQKSLWIASSYGLSFDLVQLNALFHSEGGWADSPPEWATVLSKLLYLLDELSGNIWDRAKKGSSVFGRRGVPTKALICELWAGGGKRVEELPSRTRGLASEGETGKG